MSFQADELFHGFMVVCGGRADYSSMRAEKGDQRGGRLCRGGGLADCCALRGVPSTDTTQGEWWLGVSCGTPTGRIRL